MLKENDNTMEQNFNRIMENSLHLALATLNQDAPNVRMVNFYLAEDRRGVLYFATFNRSPKVAELALSNKVAFTTIPNGREGVVRVTDAIVRKSGLTAADVKDAFLKKNPSFEETVKRAGPMLDIYEIHFNEAIVTMDPQNIGTVTL
jgi:uncharacterized pyridoxamine 5'-phosphate oxidase family protein